MSDVELSDFQWQRVMEVLWIIADSVMPKVSAVKVISKGIPPEEKPIRLICDHCKSELEFLMKEAKIHYDQRDGNFFSIECPVCGFVITKAL